MKLLTALVFTLIALPAGAADFNLTVPLRLNNIHPEVAELFVYCYVSRVATGATASDENVIGQATVAVPIPSSGDFSGTVAYARFDALPGKNPADAVYYRCFLSIGGASMLSGVIAAKNPRYIPGPGTSNVLDVGGPLRR